MYTFELSPIATLIEQTVLKRMCEIVGFPDGFGTLTTGGSNGNMIGMLCAREHSIPGSTKTGFDGSKMVAFVSAESHYSVLMAANVIGIGHQNVIKVRCDENGCMRPESLREEIDFAIKEGLTPFVSSQHQEQRFEERLTLSMILLKSLMNMTSGSM